MVHAVLSAQFRDAALIKLDQLIVEIAQLHESQTELLLEHLRSARTCLLGAMQGEYEFSLGAAKGTTAGLRQSARRRLVLGEVISLLEKAEPQPPSGRVWHRPRRHLKTVTDVDTYKGELYCFFRGYRTRLGVFYPTNHIFAAFPSFRAASKAAVMLEALGFDKDELVAATAPETFRFFAEMRANVGLWGELMAGLSRFFGTEEVFADIDIAESQEGAGFLTVYCPEEREAERIRDLLEPLEPLSMQLYLSGGVRSLCAGKSPGPQGNHPKQN
jgi:hypothetical protein